MPFTTREELIKLGEIDSELDAFLKANPLPEVLYDDIQVIKAGSEQRRPLLLKFLGEAPPEVKQTDTTYTTRDQFVHKARIYQPTTPPSEGSPLVIVIHGGGFCAGSLESEEVTARNLVRSFGAVCISIQYRLAPEFPFPYAVNDCWDAVRYFASRTAELQADPSLGFIVGGTSAGGNLGAVMALKARDENLQPPLTGQWLSIPATCPQSKTPAKYQDRNISFKQNEDAPVLPRALVDLFISAYKPDVNDSENFAVLNHPRGFKGLPPAFFALNGLDPLRDEGLFYEEALREQGVPTKLFMYPGLPHAHWSFFPTLESSKKYRADQIEGFAWLLKKKPVYFEGETTAGASTA